MGLLAIDPGSEQSAWVLMRAGVPVEWGISENDALLTEVQCPGSPVADADHLAIEYMRPRGMPMSAESMDTMFFAGRLVQAWGREWSPVDRHQVKLHICNSACANDSNIRRALIDLYGGESRAIGGVKCPKCKGKGWFGAGRPTCPECQGAKWKHEPGPLHGIAADVWQALAVAVTFEERT